MDTFRVLGRNDGVGCVDDNDCCVGGGCISADDNDVDSLLLSVSASSLSSASSEGVVAQRFVSVYQQGANDRVVGRATPRIQAEVGRALVITKTVARTLMIVVMGRLFVAIVSDLRHVTMLYLSECRL